MNAHNETFAGQFVNEGSVSPFARQFSYYHARCGLLKVGYSAAALYEVSWCGAHECSDACLPMADEQAHNTEEMQSLSAMRELIFEQLDEYFAGRRRTFTLPISYEGTVFQRRVWLALQRIAYGTTCSYGELATAINSPRACRAVGAANHHNPLAIIIPCHRVVRSGRGMGGYAGGLDKKAFLLALELGDFAERFLLK